MGSDDAVGQSRGIRVGADVVSGLHEPVISSIVDIATLQSMMDDFYNLTRIPMSVIDLSGEVVVGAGWQDVCIRFHRANPETCAYCIESDTVLTSDIPAGAARLYKCKNGMWDAAMPVLVGGKRVALVFTGQFFFDDEPIDTNYFRNQAVRYGFGEADYLRAVNAVPRLSRMTVEIGLAFLTKLANMISQLGFSYLERARTGAELQKALDAKMQLASELTAERGVLQAIMDNTDTHLAYLDPDFNFIAVNAAYVRGSGYAESELIGRNHFELFPYEDNERIFARARDTGTAVEFRARPFEFAGQPWRGVTYWDWRLAPVKGDDGAVRGLAFSLVDVTQTERARRFSDALNRLNDVIHASLDFDATIAEVVADLASALGCEAVGVMVASGDHQLRVVDVFGLPHELKGSVVQEDDFPISLDTLTRERAVILGDGSSPELARGMAAPLGIQSMLLVPLASAGPTRGALFFGYVSGPGDFDEGQVDFASKVASSLSLSLENARLYETERGIAETLQETLIVLPSHVSGVEFSRAYESATHEHGRVGGDFVDIFEVTDDLVGVTLGDVSGKGIDAAVTTSLIRTTLRVHALDGLTPSQVIKKANGVLCRFTEVESFVTLWFGLLNTSTGQLNYVCAGHPPALVMSADGETRDLEARDPILGAFDKATYGGCQTVLTHGDRLILYSDGVTEARSPGGGFLGREGLLEIVGSHTGRPTARLSEAIMADVVAFSDGVLRDDAAILAVEPAKL